MPSFQAEFDWSTLHWSRGYCGLRRFRPGRTSATHCRLRNGGYLDVLVYVLDLKLFSWLMLFSCCMGSGTGTGWFHSRCKPLCPLPIENTEIDTHSALILWLTLVLNTPTTSHNHVSTYAVIKFGLYATVGNACACARKHGSDVCCIVRKGWSADSTVCRRRGSYY